MSVFKHSFETPNAEQNLHVGFLFPSFSLNKPQPAQPLHKSQPIQTIYSEHKLAFPGYHEFLVSINTISFPIWNYNC